MQKYLIATHGKMAMGLKDTIKVLTGKEDIDTINAYTEDGSVEEALQNYFNGIAAEDKVIVFTDIAGGSVNQKIISYLNNRNCLLISGTNLPLILEIILEKREIDAELVREKIKLAKEQLVFVNDEILKVKYSEEDFF